MIEVEWLQAGCTRNKETGRWHVVVKYGDEMCVSDRSFATREEVLTYLKQVMERAGGLYHPIQ
jgi:hypothetical protein